MVYSITSKWTSFVAVSKDEPTEVEEEQKMNHYKALIDEMDIEQLSSNARIDDNPSSPGSWNQSHIGVLLFSHKPSSHAGPAGSPPRRKRGRARRPTRMMRLATDVTAQTFSSSGSSDPNEDMQVCIRRSRPLVASYKRSSFKFKNEGSTQPAVIHEESDRRGDGGDAYQKAQLHDTAETIPLPQVSFVDDRDRNFALGEPSSAFIPFTDKSLRRNPIPGLDHSKAIVDGSTPESKTRILGTMSKGSCAVDQAQTSDGLSLPPTNSALDARSGRSPDARFSSTANKRSLISPGDISSRADVYEDDNMDPLASSTGNGKLSSFGSSVMNNPLNWQFAIECQHGSGLFDLSEDVRNKIHLHFCPGAATELNPKIAQLLKKCITPEDKNKLCSRILDTLMMIECYKTHLAQEEDIWDMFIDKAWDAMLEALELSEDDLELQELQEILRSSTMHAHYLAATGIKESEKDKEGGDLAYCSVCGMAWLTAR
jgi:hypothetical protein